MTQPAQTPNAAIAAAWDQYLTETAAARDLFDHAHAQAAEVRQQAAKAVERERAIAHTQAWEDYQRLIVDAWRAYEDATDAARRARDYSIEQAATGVMPL